MPINVEWENDQKTLIRWDLLGHWTALELRQTIQKSNEMISEQDHTVNHIIDLSQSDAVPGNIIGESRYAMRVMPKNLGRVVIITKHGFIESVSKTLQRFAWFNNRVHVVQSNAEALAYIWGQSSGTTG